MNDTYMTDRLQQAELTQQQQERLFTLITAVFDQSIDVRSPKNRPPGRAGLKAEKGYYRLLYLESDFREKVKNQGKSQPEATAYKWDFIPVILRQLKDIPELQKEITEGIEAALSAVTAEGAG